jgi:hypothetical protein
VLGRLSICMDSAFPDRYTIRGSHANSAQAQVFRCGVNLCHWLFKPQVCQILCLC